VTAALNLAILVATLGSGYSLAAGVEASAATAGLEFTEEEGIELLSQSFRQAAAEGVADAIVRDALHRLDYFMVMDAAVVGAGHGAQFGATGPLH
tara:strand:- start:202 stop:486 length:285 start_codon:yes stop_codon:yes gene_type:complete